jgi:tryptophan-rich sensory protein
MAGNYAGHQFYFFMKTLLTSLKFIFISLLVGYVSMLLQSESMATWYPFLRKSSLTPPGYVFSIVWSVLYVLMGLSAGLVWSRRAPGNKVLIMMFSIQLFLNLFWSFCFFFLQQPLIAFVVLIALFLTVAAYAIGCYSRHRAAAFLNVPYMLWLLFATYLNGYVVVYN